MPEISARNLHCTFQDGTKALNGINISIKEGEFTVICGPNGSGKSVFARHLNGLIPAKEGEILLDRKNIKKDIRHARRSVGMVFQDADSQIVGQTAFKDTAFGPQNLGLKKEEVGEKAEEALKLMDLWHRKDDRPHLFSGGEKRRLAIAGLLAMDSPILIFDEPLSNLDYPAVRQVLEKIVGLHKKGHTIILITHDLARVLAHADRLIIMNSGKICADGNPAELLGLLEQNGVRKPAVKRLEQMTWLK